MRKRLYRIDNGKVIAGVCSGLGEYFDVDPVLVRLIWVVFACLWGSGLIAYVLAMFIIPKQLYIGQ